MKFNKIETIALYCIIRAYTICKPFIAGYRYARRFLINHGLVNGGKQSFIITLAREIESHAVSSKCPLQVISVSFLNEQQVY